MGDHSIGRIDSEYSTFEPNSPDPVLESYFRQQLEKIYGDPSEASAASDGTRKDKNDQAIARKAQGDDDDEEYEFHLFRRSLVSGPALNGTSSVPQRIALRSPSPAGDGSHFINGGRPDEYYFSGDTSAELAEQYAQVAVSEKDIISSLQIRWRGMELPWRVTTIKATNLGKAPASPFLAIAMAMLESMHETPNANCEMRNEQLHEYAILEITNPQSYCGDETRIRSWRQEPPNPR